MVRMRGLLLQALFVFLPWRWAYSSQTLLCSPNPATRVLRRVLTGLARHRSGQTLAGSWPGIAQPMPKPGDRQQSAWLKS